MFDRDTVSGRNVSRVKITLVSDGTRKKFNLLFEFYIKKWQGSRVSKNNDELKKSLRAFKSLKLALKSGPKQQYSDTSTKNIIEKISRLDIGKNQ